MPPPVGGVHSLHARFHERATFRLTSRGDGGGKVGRKGSLAVFDESRFQGGMKRAMPRTNRFSATNPVSARVGERARFLAPLTSERARELFTRKQIREEAPSSTHN